MDRCALTPAAVVEPARGRSPRPRAVLAWRRCPGRRQLCRAPAWPWRAGRLRSVRFAPRIPGPDPGRVLRQPVRRLARPAHVSVRSDEEDSGAVRLVTRSTVSQHLRVPRHKSGHPSTRRTTSTGEVRSATNSRPTPAHHTTRSRQVTSTAFPLRRSPARGPPTWQVPCKGSVSLAVRHEAAVLVTAPHQWLSPGTSPSHT